MTLYYISAVDPEGDADFSLMVQAETEQKAVDLWRDYYELGEDGFDIFGGAILSPATPHIALHDRYEDMARIWLVKPSGASGALIWGGTSAAGQMPFVGYIEP